MSREKFLKFCNHCIIEANVLKCTADYLKALRRGDLLAIGLFPLAANEKELCAAIKDFEAFFGNFGKSTKNYSDEEISRFCEIVYNHTSEVTENRVREIVHEYL